MFLGIDDHQRRAADSQPINGIEQRHLRTWADSPIARGVPTEDEQIQRDDGVREQQPRKKDIELAEVAYENHIWRRADRGSFQGQRRPSAHQPANETI